jgi:hypothetical protein
MNFFHPGQVDPGQLAAGAHGPPAGRPRWPRAEQLGHGGAPAGKHGGGAPARKEEGKKVQEDPWLTRSSTGRSAWPGRGRRRRILAGRRSEPAGETAMVAAIRGGSVRFLGQGGRGRRGGAGGYLGGGRGDS